MGYVELNKISSKFLDSEKDVDAHTWVSFRSSLTSILASFNMAIIKHLRNCKVSTYTSF